MQIKNAITQHKWYEETHQWLKENQKKWTEHLGDEEIDPRLVRTTRLLDEAFTIPGTPITVGLDGLLGLLPVVGDLPTMIFTLWMHQEAKRLGVSRWGKFRMWMNSSVDFLLGSIPLVGDLFDFAFKANKRNLKILQKHIERRRLEKQRRQETA